MRPNHSPMRWLAAAGVAALASRLQSGFARVPTIDGAHIDVPLSSIRKSGKGRAKATRGNGSAKVRRAARKARNVASNRRAQRG